MSGRRAGLVLAGVSAKSAGAARAKCAIRLPPEAAAPRVKREPRAPPF